MTKPLWTKDQITQSCLSHIVDVGLTKRRDQKTLARAWGSFKSLAEFLGDLDLEPLATQLVAGIRERLSEKGQEQFLKWIERRMADDRETELRIAKRKLAEVGSTQAAAKRVARDSTGLCGV